MSPSIKTPYAEKHGSLVHVSSVSRGLSCDCICPVCRDPLIARKGQVMAHHFAHSGNRDCNPETVLHDVAKRLLKDRTDIAIASGLKIKFTWPCRLCGDTHQGDIVRVAASAHLEQSVGSCRPDITLRDKDEVPRVFVEVVVTHEPEQNVRTYARANRISIVEFHIQTWDALIELLNGDTFDATRGDGCTRPKCRDCGSPLRKKVMRLVEIPCWKCKRQMKGALMNIEGLNYGPETFTADEKEIATREGAEIRSHYSETAGKRYFANTCANCGAINGRFFYKELHTQMHEGNGVDSGMA